MRIVGGTFKGRTINAPDGFDTRPTTDRVRESLFSMVEHKRDLEKARIIDLFAGSGALGLEAMSRGAAFCLFVEQAAPARAAIRDNIETLSLFGHTKLHRRSATALGDKPAQFQAPFTIAFLDAPYAQNLTTPALQSLMAGGWMSEDALFVVEQEKKEDAPQLEALDIIDERRFGKTLIRFLEFSS